MKLATLTYEQKAKKIKKKEYIIPCGQHKFIRHWGIAEWVEYVDNYGSWL